MFKFCLKSLVLGIGIGIILIASLNLLLHDTEKDTEISTEVDDTENAINQDSNNTHEKTAVDDELKTDEKNDTDECTCKNEDINSDIIYEEDNNIVNGNSVNKSEINEDEYILIEVPEGMNGLEIAELLYDKGVIRDVDEFMEVVKKLNATRILKHGEKFFKQNASLEEIIEILIKVD
ncbi:MAG: hypothetical protein ACLKAK_01845 [Alkaliphilus sp.]